MSNADQGNQMRDGKGKYDVSFDTLCVCGHTAGDHTAERPRVCIIGDFGHAHCSCENFRKSRGGR